MPKTNKARSEYAQSLPSTLTLNEMLDVMSKKGFKITYQQLYMIRSKRKLGFKSALPTKAKAVSKKPQLRPVVELPVDELRALIVKYGTERVKATITQLEAAI